MFACICFHKRSVDDSGHIIRNDTIHYRFCRRIQRDCFSVHVQRHFHFVKRASFKRKKLHYFCFCLNRIFHPRINNIDLVQFPLPELVEQNRERTEEAYRRVERLLTPMIEAGADRIVLGCTHYPFLSEAMHRVIGDRDVRLVNPAAAVEQRTETLLCEGGIEASGGSRPVYEFMTSADEAYRQRLVAKSEEARTMRFE